MFKIFDKKVIYFLILIGLTILMSIFMAGNAASILYFLVLLICYARSKDESFWFAFFFITIDGFMGFLGSYSAVLNLLPGLPGIEVAQFYIIIALYKVWKQKKSEKPFYANWTILLFCYIIILVLIGLANGLIGDTNIYFKIVKLILPLSLFYTAPRLLKTMDQYVTVINILFVVFIFAFIAQLITVFTGYSPSAKWEVMPQKELEIGRNLRTFFNPFASIVVMCGALYLLAIKQKYFPKAYLNIMVILCFGMAFLSATRGWIIAYTFIIIAFNVFVNKLEIKNLILILSLFVLVLAISLSFEKINRQIMFSIERTLTLESLAKGDVTADGTLARLDERGPRVLEAWQESPIFGYGFSNAFFSKQDPHVGNFTILLHSGIIGLALILLFLKFIISSLMKLKSYQLRNNPYKKGAMAIVIVIFGWFFIHSTSMQHFAFYGDTPAYIFPQALVLSMANFSINYKV